MLKGCDVSNWQNPYSIDFTPYDFVVIKATEGVSVTDRHYKEHYSKANSLGKLTGFYHYARPEYNTAVSEARHFVDVVKPYVGKSILALDYEGTALKYGASWALEWLKEVYRLTGVRPVIYLQGSVVKNYDAVMLEGYGLWVAHWGVSKPSISPWGAYTLWQYRGDPLDLDYFNGDSAAWKKYAAVHGQALEAPAKEGKKTVLEIAKEVINGKWGNGLVRKARLKAAGYDYNAVQAKVNELLAPKKTVSELANEVLAGKWGNGEERKTRLTKAGYDYEAVQKKVNEIQKSKSNLTYIVQKGDTLSGIALKFGTSYLKIAEKNNIKAPYIIYPGQRLKI